MATSASCEREKEELRAALNSSIFAKAPRQAKLLEYICHEYFEGRSDQIKEYNLATNVMGKAPDFDQNRDAIVRVEFHRLRNKLKQYYETEGAGHALRIVIDHGRYVPRFVYNEQTTSSEPQVELGNPPTPESKTEPPGLTGVAIPAKPHWNRRFRLLLTFSIILGLIVAARVISFHWWRRPGPRAQGPLAAAVAAVAAPPVATVVSAPVRILCGYAKDKYIDRDGNAWQGDRYYSGGEALSQPQQFIARASDLTLFDAFRSGAFSYDIPLKPGNYELHLYFVETHYGPGTLSGGGETSRLFNVRMNGASLLKIFDIIKDAGGNNVADERVFRDVKPAPDGYLHLRLEALTDAPILSALEIVTAPPGRMNAIRIAARDHSYTDHAGNLWESDRYYSGGQLAVHIARIPVSSTPDPNLYSGERFGNFSYAIPVPAGKYKVTLRFAETYWAVPNRYPSIPDQNGSLEGGVGSRVFDVYCNGSALLRNFDILKEAGSTLKALDKTFHNLQPNAEGKLLLMFVPVRDYACINAIEVADETK